MTHQVLVSTKGTLVGLQWRIWLSDLEPHSRPEGAGPAMTRMILAFACCIAVAARATEQKVIWARTDGRPVVQTLLEIDQADCRDEVQKENTPPATITRSDFCKGNQRSMINLPAAWRNAAIWRRNNQHPLGRFWPEAAAAFATFDVRFQGLGCRDADITRCRSLTQLGRGVAATTLMISRGFGSSQ